MKKLSRLLLFVVGGLLVILITSLLAVNLYVQSKRTHARIQEELSQRLGTTLRIQRISVTPWFGLKLTGITMPQSEGPVSQDFLRADTFRMAIGFRSLFTGRLVIKEIALVRPQVIWAQNADGEWRLPSLPPERTKESLAQSNEARPAEAAPQSTQTTAPTPESRPAAEETPEREEEFAPEIRRVSLTNGSFHFLDAKGAPVASFDGLSFRSNVRKSAELRGNATIKKISLRDRFFLQDLQSPLRYEPDELEFSQIGAHTGGGDVTGQFHMLQTESGSPFVASVEFRDVQVDRIVTEAGGPAGMLQGRIEGRLNANGKTADPNALTGAGEIYLRDGEVRRYSLLIALGQLLQLEDLAQLHLDQAYVKYHITPGVVTVDELNLSSPNIRLSAKGTVGFNGKLRLDSRLAINEKVRSQLFRAVRDNFHPLEEAGYAAVDFQVSGTIEHPKTNLMGKLIGPEVKDLGGIISTLLGGKMEKPKKKEEAAPNESPSPTP